MKKMPHVFKFEKNEKGNASYIDEVNPECEWVLNQEGISTRKWDGTCCLVKDGVLYKRREVKSGKKDPEGFFLADGVGPDDRRMGWVLPEEGEKHYQEAWKNFLYGKSGDAVPIDGTYELCGPKINGNPEGLEAHVLIKHGGNTFEGNGAQDRTLSGLRHLKSVFGHMEGVVFHHSDGRMAKFRFKLVP